MALQKGMKGFNLQSKPCLGSPLAGRCFHFDRFTIKHVPPEAYEIYFKADRDVIAIMSEPFDVNGSFDSDRVRGYHILPGRAFFHPAGSTSYVRRQNPQGEFISFHLDPSMRATLERESTASFRPMEHLVNVPLPQISAIGQMTRQFISDRQQGCKLVAESLATLALAEVLKMFASPKASQDLCVPGNYNMARIADYIDAHLGDDIGIDVLAREVAVSPYHFIRSFKKHFKITPHAYVLERRIAKVKEMLLANECSISRIAYVCGFSSQSHLNTAFKRIVGVTPGQYRKSIID